METIIEVDGEVIGTTILDTVEFHCDVLLNGMITTYSELLDSPMYRWTVKHIHYDKQKDITIIRLEDTAW